MSTSPLSRAQRGLWFLHRLRPESAAYNLATAARVLGARPAAEIRAFFQGMVDRHAVLRATFHREGEEPVQRVHASVEVAFAEIDARGWTEREVRAAIEDAAWRPFDLERGPVFRVVLLRREGERLLVVAMHHIVADFGSIGLFPAAGEREGKDYADFIAWQSELLAGAEGERLWSWWRDRLAGLPELDLPADRLRPDHPEAAPERAGLATGRIDPATLAPLKALARSRRATVYVALLAAFHALLHRLTGQEDCAVGSPASGRPKGFGRTFGYFTNPLVLRADVAGDPPFRELLDRTRQTVAEALEHQHFPLALLVERLRPGGELFRTLFVLHQGPEGLVRLVLGKDGGRLPLAGFELESVALPPRAAPFDLTLAAGELDDGLALDLVYATARFDAPTAARWLEHLGHLVAGAVAQPETPVSALPLLGAAERHQLLIELNDRGAVDLLWPTLHAGFDRQVERTPHALALIDGERRLTYRELHERAAELAERLRGMGVGPETVVGVRLPRTAELIVALLGVLKAGGAYLPLDPAYPEERIAFMVEDARAALVLADSGWEGAPSPALRGRVGEEGLAYLIYTSGSTGRPKGVAIGHAAAVRLVAWAGQAFSAAELRGVLAATSICFDLSIFEIFVPLSYGGTVILAENALAVPALPARGEITLINTVPSALAALLELGGLPPSVLTVNLAGEPLRRALADRILALGVKLWDLYGPSEDTTYSTGAVVAIGDPAEPAIGAPLAGSTAYVLDRRLHPLPLGLPGELFLGGTALARGYLGRPDLTAEKFLPSPFGRPSDLSDPTDPTDPSDAFGARLYRTGDLVRRRADGALEYLGRIDHQVKIRGFRIELGEVEAALLAIAWVREAVVVAREGAMVAYVGPGEGLPAQPEEALRAALRERLPAPFVPAFFVLLAALPRTPNGKVDRKALPAPGGGAEAAVSVPPAGAVEEALAALWGDLLGQSGIGRHDRFFDRGGHSLLAARVLARVREIWGTEIPLAAFFAEPTLAGLARRIEGTVAQGSREAIPWAARDRPLPLSRAQQRFWLLDRLEPGQATYNVPLALHLRGPLDPAVPADALGALVRRHEALRTTVAAEDDGTWQRIGPAPDGLPLPCVDLDALPEDRRADEAGRIAVAAARRPFDLEGRPPLRTVLVALAPREHRLLLTLHHIVADAWSMTLLARELSALYGAFAERRPSPLREPAVGYGDVAAWWRHWLTGEVLERQLAFWRRRLAGAPALLELPTDRPRPARQSYRGTLRPVRLPAGLTAQAQAFARREGATLFMVLLAAFQALLARCGGQEDLAVGTPVAGRNRVEIENLIGFFVNTLVLRGDLRGEPSFSTLLARVRETALAAYLHQDLPFE
ncbi:MAG TPA: non-ribosomal peptide synthetase, partial [Acidobacteria bacterium]|nr:non-ribosomal peptide synthetase [Acidobacteriota bacterium]